MSHVINRQQIKTVEFLLPEYWATALMYGDTSGLEDDELTQLEHWITENPNLSCVDIADDAGFYRFHDADHYVLPTNCCTFTFMVIT